MTLPFWGGGLFKVHKRWKDAINKKKIIDKINTYFGYSFIKNIHVKIINVKFIDSSKNHTTKINKKSFINNLKKVENINLKNKLEKLIKAYNEKN